MSEPRFYVLEHEGYTITPSATSAGNQPLVTEIMVLDRDYNHRVVWTRTPRGGRWHPQSRVLARARVEAASKCAELNAWHKEAMSA